MCTSNLLLSHKILKEKKRREREREREREKKHIRTLLHAYVRSKTKLE